MNGKQARKLRRMLQCDLSPKSDDREHGAIAVGGNTTGSPSTTNTVLTYDGTNWASTTNYPTTIANSNFAGVQTNGVAFSGQVAGPTNYQVISNTWDGSTWTSSANRATGIVQGGAGGKTDSSEAIGFGGFQPGSPAYFGGSEEFTGAFNSTLKFTTS